jgi:cytoskeletal protein RodZ
MSPLGETLRRARLAKGITFEDAERVTRIPRKYLEALEVENYGIMPAPVYARGFLRSYAGYLGLDPQELLPFFPVGHVEEPKLEPLPEVTQPQRINPSGMIAIGVVGALVLLVVLIYSIGRGDSESPFVADRLVEPPAAEQGGGVITAPNEPAVPAVEGPATAIPDLVGLTAEEAIAIVEETGASYIVIVVAEGDVPSNQVVSQDPEPGAAIGPGDLVNIAIAR